MITIYTCIISTIVENIRILSSILVVLLTRGLTIESSLYLSQNEESLSFLG